MTFIRDELVIEELLLSVAFVSDALRRKSSNVSSQNSDDNQEAHGIHKRST